MAPGGQTSHPPEHVPPGTDAAVRLIQCPQCGRELNVTPYDPLEVIHCDHCGREFELLREFGDFDLVKTYDAGWLNAVYLGVRRATGERAIIKILSAHASRQPGAIERFLREAEELGDCGPDGQVAERAVDQVNGLVCLRLVLKEGAAEGEVLEALGIATEPEVAFQMEAVSSPSEDDDPPSDEEDPAPVVVPDRGTGAQGAAAKPGRPLEVVRISLPSVAGGRFTCCPRCKATFDVARLDPLDRITCQACGRKFELLRDFSHYRIDGRLGAGGTSALFRAWDVNSFRTVALKVLSATEMGENPGAVGTFHREIEAMRKLKHPNIVQIYEGGEFGGFHYMAMELVDGLTLHQVLKAIQGEDLPGAKDAADPPDTPSENVRYKRALPELVCLEVMLKAAAGLGAAHEQGLVHGDVKPENIMITYEGEVKVVDFGLVQFANTETLLAEGGPYSIFGTPLYIPPERVRGEPEDFRSDIYSLGATLYHLLRGIPPFRAKTPTQLAMMHAEHLLVTFKAYVPSASDTTCHIVEKSLKKIVADRYSSHSAFIADLTRARNQVLAKTMDASKDGRAILRRFMKTMPRPKTPWHMWKRSAVTLFILARRTKDMVRKRFHRG